MTYSQKLRDPRWQKKRLEIMNRDNWQCIFCGCQTENLQVHHILYQRKEPWEYPDYLYQTLCEKCHLERQEWTDKIVNALRIAIAKVPTVRLVEVSTRICGEAMLEIEVEK